MINLELMKQCAAEQGVTLGDAELKKFDIYAEALVETNKQLNLTAITEPDDIVVKHFADSLTVLGAVECKESAKVLDVGTGAGFPGVALLFAKPDIRLTLLDGTKKKLTFIETTLDSMGLEADFVHARAEEAGQNRLYRESFDLVTARAVANLRELAEYCLPFVAQGGHFVAMKGVLSQEELDGAQYAIKQLGGETEQIKRFNLYDAGERTLITIKKISQTPTAYPRPSAKIAKQPLKFGRKR